jgi:microcystin-dependent protein
MSTPFLSEIRIMSFNFAPKGWALCNGQLMPINQNQPLFALLGTTYGGDGRVNFALPNLQGHVPIHMGSGFTLGQTAGQEGHTLIMSEMPQHNHLAQARAAVPGVVGGNVGASNKVVAEGLAIVTAGNQAVNIWGTGAPNASTLPSATTNAGGSQSHENRQPFLTLNFCIALQGIFPSQN